MKLVVIESPGKRDTLKKYLGDGYEVFFSKGHVRDLPEKTFGVDLNKNFEPTYETLPDKKALIEDLKKHAKKAESIYLATDPDREGEAISWHLAHYLGLKPEDKCRIVFNEISKSAVESALKEPRAIDMKTVDAQQARRILDRIVGYKVSPIICKKIKPNISAGRVQSVALKLVCDREKEILNFKPEEYWNVFAILSKQESKAQFKANLIEFKNKKIKLKNAEEVEEVTKGLNSCDYIVEKIKKTVSKSHAPAPFITSTMQQEAMNKLSMSVKVVTMTAQTLYEGVELGHEGKVALITYIRTDSTRISEGAIAMAKEHILDKYGKEYCPSKPNIFAKKQSAQDAHEAIRPISLKISPESIKEKVKPDVYKLYKLIYERFVACQMSEAEYDNVTVDIKANECKFRVVGKTPKFAGWTAAYKIVAEETEENQISSDKLPKMEEGETLKFYELKKEQKFTKPPPRFTDSSLIKEMEENGIGRPATYAPTVTLLSSRNYIAKDGKNIYPTELGNQVTDYLEKYFKSIFNVKFTAHMESRLDDIAENGEDWHNVISKLWEGLKDLLTIANSGEKIKAEPEKTDIMCDKCGNMMYIREGKYGKFLGCSNFPKCRNIQPLVKEEIKYAGICPQCGKKMQERKSKKGKIYYSCNGYPDCKFMSWDVTTGNKCPKCGSHIIEKTSKDKVTIKCSNGECDYIE